MSVSRVHLEAVRVAAANLFSAHIGEGKDAEEGGGSHSDALWDALQAALTACDSQSGRLREEAFRIDDAGDLVRSVVPIRGDPHEDRCTRESFVAVARAVDGCTRPFTLEGIQVAAEVTWTPVAVALASLKERGVVVPAAWREGRSSSQAVLNEFRKRGVRAI